MRLIDQPGGSVWVADAPNWLQDGEAVVQIGVTTAQIKAGAERSLRTWLAQLYGIISTGLIHTEHVFRGLKRDMLVEGNGSAEKEKYAFTWAAKRDAVLVGDRFQPEISYCTAPENRVFAVYVSTNHMTADFPAVSGWAEHWTWIAADPDLIGAPIEWAERYDSCVWHKQP